MFCLSPATAKVSFPLVCIGSRRVGPNQQANVQPRKAIAACKAQHVRAKRISFSKKWSKKKKLDEQNIFMLDCLMSNVVFDCNTISWITTWSHCSVWPRFENQFPLHDFCHHLHPKHRHVVLRERECCRVEAICYDVFYVLAHEDPIDDGTHEMLLKCLEDATISQLQELH